MSHVPAVRVTELVEITEPGRTVRIARVVERLGHGEDTPPPTPGGEISRGYDPERDSPMAGSGWSYVPPLPPPHPGTPALPTGDTPAPWWRRWVR